MFKHVHAVTTIPLLYIYPLNQKLKCARAHKQMQIRAAVECIHHKKIKKRKVVNWKGNVFPSFVLTCEQKLIQGSKRGIIIAHIN